ncbi:hypothetical protein HY631_03230 [Candidatus Uhrbacteria bacterium]|nr:hypothetical protein [Candidatus Uhrbacteria bacterium]
MFEDVKKEPEDIFSESDASAPQVVPPTEPPPGPAPVMSPMAQRPAPARRSFPWKPALLVVAIVVVVGAAFYLSVQILRSKTPVTPEPPAQDESAAAPVSNSGAEEEETSVPSDLSDQGAEEEKKPSSADTDKDGLTNDEEEALGTSPRAADTDGDGLFDLEEVRTWETNPLNPDTDGDGYLDGEEVSGGYNPNGEGALREAPTESD